jgi:uncharacterized protein (DUF488 family)
MIYTIGHSTHPIGEFLAMLSAFGIEHLADVRTIPKSRFNPQFNSESLRKSLIEHSITYDHRPGLGGLRKPLKESINAGWRNASFRGYADYMQTPAFVQHLETLIKDAKKKRLAIMCAEAVPWRCHRSLIADALVSRGIDVQNIMSAQKATPHALNRMARLKEGGVYYPDENPSMF